jgi:hypothetical protein
MEDAVTPEDYRDSAKSFMAAGLKQWGTNTGKHLIRLAECCGMLACEIEPEMRADMEAEVRELHMRLSGGTE